MAARERAGLSRSEAAVRLGVTPDAVGKIERDDNPPSLQTLDKMAEAYGCLIGDLLPNSGSGAAEDMFAPLRDAMFGLTGTEIRDQILILAAQARLNRNILSRAQRVAHTSNEVEARKVATDGLRNETSRSAGTYAVGTTKTDVPRLPAHLLTEQPDPPQGGTRHADSGRQRHQSPTKGRPR